MKSAVQAGLDSLALAETWAQNGTAKESWRARIAEIRAQLLEPRNQINRDTGAGAQAGGGRATRGVSCWNFC